MFAYFHALLCNFGCSFQKDEFLKVIDILKNVSNDHYYVSDNDNNLLILRSVKVNPDLSTTLFLLFS